MNLDTMTNAEFAELQKRSNEARKVLSILEALEKLSERIEDYPIDSEMHLEGDIIGIKEVVEKIELDYNRHLLNIISK